MKPGIAAMMGSLAHWSSASFKFATAVERYRLEARALGVPAAEAEVILLEEIAITQASTTTTDFTALLAARHRLLRKALEA